MQLTLEEQIGDDFHRILIINGVKLFDISANKDIATGKYLAIIRTNYNWQVIECGPSFDTKDEAIEEAKKMLSRYLVNISNLIIQE